MMIDALYGELRTNDRMALTVHVADCSECQQRLGRLRSVLGTLDRWPAPSATGRIAARALKRVAIDGAPAPTGARVRTVLSHALWGVSAGMRRARRRGRSGVRQRTLWTAAWLALAAATIAVTFRLWLPVSNVVDICDRWIHTSFGVLPFIFALLFIATASSAGPLFVGRFVFLHRARDDNSAANATFFIVYAAILAPVVYHQCLSLPSAVQALWISGTVLGAALAGPPSLRWLRRRWIAR